MSRIEVLAVTGIGEVHPGDDLAAVIAAAAPWLVDGDILVVTSKIVSKSEGQLVDVPEDGPEREAAREAVLAAETARTIAQRGPVRIVQTHHGFVMAAAGIDASNVDATRLVLLPKDPDASARALRAALRERHGLDVAVVITDTMGRPWRLGLTDVAIGAAGVEALTDYRGTRDAYGNELQLTQMAVIDELAGAAELVKGKSDQVPVAVVRGVRIARDGADGLGAAALVRGADADLFSLGTAEAKSAGMREVAGLPDAVAFAPGPVRLGPVPFPRLDPGQLGTRLPPNTAAVLAVTAPDGDPWTVAQTGAQVQRLRAALAADGLTSAWVRVEVPDTGGVGLGVLAIGHPIA